MLPTTAITRITSTEGIASTGLVRLMCFIDANIWKLTMSKIAPVTTEGIARKIGEKNIAAQKQSAVTAAVTPVLPPSATPAALSRYVVEGVVPNNPLRKELMASTCSILDILVTRPFGRARLLLPNSVEHIKEQN